MLLNISIRNYGPFRDKISLSMESTALDGNEGNTLECPGSPYPLLSSAAIFGPNASGKSYVLKAVNDLQNMIRGAMPPNFTYPWYQPFRASDSTTNEPVEFDISLIENGVKYDYSIAFLRDHVTEESLHYYPHGKSALVFKRTDQEFIFGRSAMKGLNASSKLTSPASSFLALAAQYNNTVCSTVHKAITKKILIIGSNPSVLLNEVIQHINSDPNTKSRMIKALGIADFGIVDMKGIVQTKKLTDADLEIPPQVIGLMMAAGNINVNQTTLLMTHAFTDGDTHTSIDFPFDIESNGTMQFFCLMGPIIEALENGYTIMLDEFGTFLHSDISKWIINQFRSTSNPNKAQLIVNTQDQSLLDLDLLRRDQIWFTNKNRDGAAELYAMSDFNGIRQDADVQKSYSAGKFDAKPFVKFEDVMD